VAIQELDSSDFGQLIGWNVPGKAIQEFIRHATKQRQVCQFGTLQQQFQIVQVRCRGTWTDGYFSEAGKVLDTFNGKDVLEANRSKQARATTRVPEQHVFQVSFGYGNHRSGSIVLNELLKLATAPQVVVWKRKELENVKQCFRGQFQPIHDR